VAKPERNFINRIHRKISPVLYKQAMGLTSTNGTPDYYYEGRLRAELWVEYKWYPEEPEEIDLCDTKKKTHLSMLQQNWLERANRNGVKVAVVAGYPKGCIVLRGEQWMSKHTTSKRFLIKDHKWTELEWAEYLDGLDIQGSNKDSRKTK
jgi:hypothetical protein